jgi:hypothetical protein
MQEVEVKLRATEEELVGKQEEMSGLKNELLNSKSKADLLVAEVSNLK